MLHKVVLFLVIVMLLGVVPVHAQDAELQCSPDQIQEITTQAIELLQSGDYDSTVEARSILTALDSLCLGLDLEGTGGAVFGPVEIPEGYYRVTVTGSGSFFVMDGTIIDGKCGKGFGDTFSVFLYMSSDFMSPGPIEEEALLTSEGCTVLWEISDVSAPYVVTFEKIK